MPNFLIFAALYPMITGKRVVLDVHDTLLETYASKFDRGDAKSKRTIWGSLLAMEEAICCRLATHVVCVNHVQKEALAKRGIPEHKLTVVLNTPDPRWFQKIDGVRALGQNGAPFRLVYFGTLAKRLGVDLALHAVCKIKNTIERLEFHVIGDGEQRRELGELSQELGIADNVAFHDGMYPIDELSGVLEKMDLVVVPNRRDAATELMLPVKMLEGVALGIPIVAPRLKGSQFYFAEDAVFYYDAGNVNSLAAAIVQAYEDSALRVSKATKAKEFLAEYGWERHRSALLNLYGAPSRRRRMSEQPIEARDEQ
jgi:glycosyltransferase involved in cell wall biosynthesis